MERKEETDWRESKNNSSNSFTSSSFKLTNVSSSVVANHWFRHLKNILPINKRHLFHDQKLTGLNTNYVKDIFPAHMLSISSLPDILGQLESRLTSNISSRDTTPFLFTHPLYKKYLFYLISFLITLRPDCL